MPQTPEATRAEALLLVKGWGLGIDAVINATPPEDIFRNRIFDRLLPEPIGRGLVTLCG